MDPPPPVSRNGFEYYNDEFYVLVHPNHRHRRSTIPELRAFFNTSPNTTSLKDKPAHWYRAQLIHYGLQPIDRKDTATVRLLDALKQGTLRVPEYIERMEREMKSEYNSKKKSALKPGRKRNAPTVKKRLGGFADLDIDREELGAGNPKRSGRLGFSVSNLNINFNIGGFGGARKSAKTTPKVKPELSVLQEMMRMGNSPSRNDDPQSSRGRPRPRLALDPLNGSYKIDSFATDTRNSGMTLRVSGPSLWGEFQLGFVQGILYMAQRPWNISYEDGGGCPFLWRTRDLDTGLGIYGPQHCGEMRFLDDGNVDGIFYNFPDGEGGWLDCEVWGRRIAEVELGIGRDAASMRMEFESIGR
ncbi:hypothetical protein P170DRAFT_472326 [Aspergillus steynii IBT 23096]|uniref:Uncharacterized protein n=1 Tax=Aspergillus steynii IBT 23096 TaxID=1392250 RepID=A0A2I2GHS5_9EURO|nr:uncharacterized protein P170DRAFT_472326 [Aspergillus steynii IBT 23096]PLB52433.1 hypothetical protein P170DRAFT_472326 [Aspergillus steynii IBT 23096]